MQAIGHADSFVGRTAEFDVLKAELAATRSGLSRVVLIEGPAGIGKSALIDRLLVDEPDLTVLRAAGERWEAFVAFGVIDQLMRSTKISRARLLADRERSLPAEEPVGVGRRVLLAIEDMEATSPVVLVVDDAHWADLDSLRTLLFVTRRLVDARVLTLLAERTENDQRLPEGSAATGRWPHRAHSIKLAPLRPSTTSRNWPACSACPAMSGRAARRLYEHTDGNPLYITSLLSEVPQGSLEELGAALPAPRSFAARIVHRMEACSAEARGWSRRRRCWTPTGRCPTWPRWRAWRTSFRPWKRRSSSISCGLGDGESGLEAVSFVHPLVRAAVYGRLGRARLVVLHLAAAHLVDDEAAALRHRVIAATQPGSRTGGTSCRCSREIARRWGRGPPRHRPCWRRPGSAAVGRSVGNCCSRPSTP